MEIKTLENTSEQEVLDTFNQSFADYTIPFQLNREQLNAKIKTENIKFKRSVGVYDDEKLVGFILHGERMINNTWMAYNGGTGVIPAKRGNGLTKKMYEYIIPKLRAQNFIQINLEVIANNEPAIKSYRKAGFEIFRKLNCFKGELSELAINPAIELTEIKNPNIDQLSQIGEVQATWQNGQASWKYMLDKLLILGAKKDGKLVGFVALNQENNRILQIAVKHHWRKNHIGSSLMHAIKENYSKQVSIINVDAKSTSLNNFFKSIGLENYVQQYEMTLKLR